MNILIWIVLGAVAGWIAGMIMKSSHGIIEDVILGVVGAFIGGFIFNFFGQPGVTGLNIYSIVVAVIGAVILIFLGRIIHK
jgi:uncharacterized membrane protein YeaQ/YmgE (transglycosylase-associated protein family)